MSAARRRRRWRRWDRYVDYCCRFGENVVATRGMEKAYNQRAVALSRRNQRSAVWCTTGSRWCASVEPCDRCLARP